MLFLIWLLAQVNPFPVYESTTTVAVAGTATTACVAQKVLIYQNMTFTVRNTGANVLTACTVEQSADGITYSTVSDSWTDCSELAAGAQTTWSISGHSFKYIRVRVTAAAAPNNTTVSCIITGNAG
ncbi:MAG: CARDB domain-containing protein [Candidatus Paceibacterota bacterium]